MLIHLQLITSISMQAHGSITPKIKYIHIFFQLRSTHIYILVTSKCKCGPMMTHNSMKSANMKSHASDDNGKSRCKFSVHFNHILPTHLWSIDQSQVQGIKIGAENPEMDDKTAPVLEELTV